jgi:hypothetical protein
MIEPDGGRQVLRLEGCGIPMSADSFVRGRGKVMGKTEDASRGKSKKIRKTRANGRGHRANIH